jgi:hypothetical protein
MSEDHQFHSCPDGEVRRLEIGSGKLDGRWTYLVVTPFFACLLAIISDIKFIWHGVW